MLKRIVKSVLATSLGWQAAALFRTGHVVVLMYHRINADDTDVTAFPGLAVSQFRGQMEWLKKNCTPVLPGEFLDAAKRTSRIKPPVVVTFDDGYRDYRERAYPILRELNIPAIVFLSTALVDRGGLIWTEAVHHATMSTNVSFIDLPWLSQVRIALSNHEEKVAFILHCKAYLKGVRNDVRLQHLDDLFQRLGAADPGAQLDRQMLSWDDVRATLDGTEYGGHSHTHPILSQLPDDEMEREIAICQQRIREETGKEAFCFAYPNGRPSDFNDKTKQALSKYGFKVAFSTVRGAIAPDADLLALPRQHSGHFVGGRFAALIARPDGGA